MSFGYLSGGGPMKARLFDCFVGVMPKTENVLEVNDCHLIARIQHEMKFVVSKCFVVKMSILFTSRDIELALLPLLVPWAFQCL